MNNNKDSLRQQIIDAMVAYCEKRERTKWCSPLWNKHLFDEAIMPVLDAAMEAGELLLHRATTPMKPVPELIRDWLDGTCSIIAEIHNQEHTLSKRRLLTIIYDLEKNAVIALADAMAIQPSETTSGALGGLLDGKSSPAKG